jgi:hypothetical protein
MAACPNRQRPSTMQKYLDNFLIISHLLVIIFVILVLLESGHGNTCK